MKTSNQIFITLILAFFTFFAKAQITFEPAFPDIGFDFIAELQSPKDGTDRVFVVEQSGRIQVFPRKSNVQNSEVTNFLDITSDVLYSVGQEIGLLGLAFHPNYKDNGYFYVYYTASSPVSGIAVRMVLSRFSVSASDPNKADPNSELVIFQFDKNQNNSNHNGGKIAFGPDSYLYISFGDGGGGNDPMKNSQNKNNVFGSICRIDVDLDGSNPIESNPTLPNGNYEIPSDNPFVGVDGLDEIFVYGVRNVWKFSFDTANGRMWGADVGQNAFEEVNIIEKGKNYGWSRFEANSVANSGDTVDGPVVFPVHFYDRSRGDRSITGGYVYKGSQISSLSPDINSKYIFGDFVSGRVWSLDYNPTTGNASSTFLFRASGLNISSFMEDIEGELYFSDYGSDAQLYKLIDGVTPSAGTAVDGIGAWNNLGDGIPNGIVSTITTSSNGNIYHGGTFNEAGTIEAINIAVYHPDSGWNALGNNDTDGAINVLKLDTNGNLYAGGAFSKIGGVNAKNIAVWDGTSWSPVGPGVDGPVSTLAITDTNQVYAAGIFETVDGTEVRNIALWNGTQWQPLTDATTGVAGTNNEIRSLHLDVDGTLYAGGNFDEAGEKTANRIASWNGTNWGTLGTGTSGFVEAIVSTPSDIFLGGNFAIAGDQTVNRIARWNKNTSTWSTLGNGVNNIVNELLHDGTNLYAAGTFDLANENATSSIIVNNIAQWNETTGWKPLGTNTNVGVDIKINSIVFASDVNGTEKIFAGGNFSNAGMANANNTAQWTSDNVLSIDEFSEPRTLLLYPNPTNGMVTLASEQKWTLTDITGKILAKGNSVSVNLLGHVSGIYLLHINNRNTIKIIKK